MELTQMLLRVYRGHNAYEPRDDRLTAAVRGEFGSAAEKAGGRAEIDDGAAALLTHNRDNLLHCNNWA